ncbi:MAG: F5/8 type C domain protein [Lentisphaerae bacterium ADurb.BinA184]|nr:MAG: F5/8 type C domain protein [Lentisphaerae bacterium ADurb.BinA184]
MTRSLSNLVIAALVMVVLGVGAAQAAQWTFLNPTEVNLLERWDADGTYGLPVVYSGDPAWRAVDYSAPGSGWRVNKGGTPYLAYAEWTFPQEVTLGNLDVFWRAYNHSPNNYQFLDGDGNIIASNADAGRFEGLYTHPLSTPVTTDKLRLQFTMDTGTDYYLAECNNVGAYLASGESLAIDGTYNILYDEDAPATITGSGYSPTWYDHIHGSNGAKPDTAGGSIQFQLSQKYLINGAFIPQYDSGRYLANMALEVSMDGASWTTVYSDSEWHFRTENPPRELGYVVLNSPYSTAPLLAQYVRLSWGPNLNPVELGEFQLFGTPVPEPATLSVLALGGLALLRRRR